MKSSSIRFIVILATVCIVGITITQVYWLRRAFDLKESEFERTVNAALFNVANQIFEINNTPSPAMNPVKQVSTNYFIVLVNGDVKASLLEFLLRSEFEKRNIQVDFEYGVYDCNHGKMTYGDYVSFESSTEKVSARKLPEWDNYAYYFGVQFPNREAHILNQMGIWSFSSVVLLIVIVFFAYTIFVILKQKRLSEIQKDFINNMTHEFKTPISTIAVSAEVLKNPDIIRHPERLLNYTTIIEKENSRLRQQVERVLQAARLEKEDIGLRKESVDMHEVIRDAIKNTTMALEEKQGSINCNLQATQHALHADRLHLVNVIYNLIDNAIKYCTQTPEITIYTRNEGANLVVGIEDNGIGISKEHVKRIFEKFYRVPTGNLHDVKGFGIGLNYVRSIIELHKGEVKVQSTPGSGSMFQVILPL